MNVIRVSSPDGFLDYLMGQEYHLKFEYAVGLKLKNSFRQAYHISIIDFLQKWNMAKK